MVATEDRSTYAACEVNEIDATWSFDECPTPPRGPGQSRPLPSGAAGADIAAEATGNVFVRALPRPLRGSALTSPAIRVTSWHSTFCGAECDVTPSKASAPTPGPTALVWPGSAEEVFTRVAELPAQQRRVAMLIDVADLTDLSLEEGVAPPRLGGFKRTDSCPPHLSSVQKDHAASGGSQSAE